MKVSLAFVVAMAAAHAPILLYARSAGSDVAVGTVTVDGRSVNLDKAETEGAGPACVGTKDLANHECFGYTELSSDWGVDVFLDKQAEIARLLIRQGPGRVYKFREEPQPNLKAWAVTNRKSQDSSEKPKEKKGPHTEKKVTKKTIVEEDEQGNKVEREVEIEEEVIVDDRLFVQKYWVYMVIPLVMFMLQKDPQNQRPKQD